MKEILLIVFGLLLSTCNTDTINNIEKNNSKETEESRQSNFDFLQPDVKNNVIPDFSKVGFLSGGKNIPNVPVVYSIEPKAGDNRENIQNAINKIAAMPIRSNGFRGALLLKKGTYPVNGSIFISASGIVIRGVGTDTSNGTVVQETAKEKTNLFCFTGNGSFQKSDNKIKIAEDFVPVGRKYVKVKNASRFQQGDSVLVYRPGTDNWIHDLKMDQIVERIGTVQWKASSYNLYFERIVSSISGDTIFIDNPIVMQIDENYGGGYLLEYHFPGRIKNCGIENLLMESTYQSETDEDHGWIAVNFSKVNQGWAQNIISKYFGYSCVYIDYYSRNISVLNSQCLEAKSIITGGRRYSFNCNGQLNLFKNCYCTEGRHDYVTGSKVCGPNVFTQCKALNTHSDIGPHHRWACGTLFDMINTDGVINVQDRGNYGTGHGWAGVTQVLWNCTALKAAVQSPWVSGKNYCIGFHGAKYFGRFTDRTDGEWEELSPEQESQAPSLYEAQKKGLFK